MPRDCRCVNQPRYGSWSQVVQSLWCSAHNAGTSGRTTTKWFITLVKQRSMRQKSPKKGWRSLKASVAHWGSCRLEEVVQSFLTCKSVDPYKSEGLRTDLAHYPFALAGSCGRCSTQLFGCCLQLQPLPPFGNPRRVCQNACNSLALHRGNEKQSIMELTSALSHACDPETLVEVTPSCHAALSRGHAGLHSSCGWVGSGRVFAAAGLSVPAAVTVRGRRALIWPCQLETLARSPHTGGSTVVLGC